MSLDHLTTLGQPHLVTVDAAATEGRTWRWEFVDLTEQDGITPLDLTGVTGECAIVTEVGGEVIAQPVVTGIVGGFVVELDETSSQGLAANTKDGRRCRWGCVLSDETQSVQIWGPSTSHLVILPN